MTTPFSYPLITPAPATPTSPLSPTPSSTTPETPSPATRIDGQPAFLGRGVLFPFRRDGASDLANGGGIALVRASVHQILNTRAATPTTAGEIPWRGSFGSRIHLLKHKKNTTTLQALAEAYVSEALQRWEPRVLLRSVTVIRETTSVGRRSLTVRIVYAIIDRNVPGNRVFLAEHVEQDVDLLLAA